MNRTRPIPPQQSSKFYTMFVLVCVLCVSAWMYISEITREQSHFQSILIIWCEIETFAYSTFQIIPLTLAGFQTLDGDTGEWNDLISTVYATIIINNCGL